MVKYRDDGRWWVNVRGLVLPAPVAAHPALELANTWAGWSADGREVAGGRDYLETGEHLAVLATDRGLLPLDSYTDVGDDTLAEARALRPASYRLARGMGIGDDLALVSRLAVEARTHQRLASVSGGVRWVMDAGAGGRAPLLAMAASLADLLAHDDPGRVGACPGRGCGWLFLNTSGRRRWCLMEVCGNRAKQAAYAARH